MKAHILLVPNNGNPFDWFSFINDNLKLDIFYDKLIVDFNQINGLDTDDIVVLACLIENFHLAGCNITFEGGTPRLNGYLYNIKFKDYWAEGFNRGNFTVSLDPNTLCLWKISKSMIDSYATHAKQYFKNTFLNNKDLIPLSSNLQEVFNNIFDHSNSEVSGYVITQYYPDKHKLSFSVCDFGIGIPTSINNYREKHGKKPIEDYEALLKSLSEGFSVHSTPQNRGFGLNNIKEFVDVSNGKLVITSNNGFLSLNTDGKFNLNSYDINFHGTLIKVSINTQNLEEYDDDEEIYDL